MSKKITTPNIPDEITLKIKQLNSLLDDANSIYEEIFDWYDAELKSYNASCHAQDELFSPNGAYVVPTISIEAIMEGLTTIQTFNETYPNEK